MKLQVLLYMFLWSSGFYVLHANTPVAIPQTAIVLVNSTTNVITLTGIDSGGSALTFSVPGVSAHGSITFISKPNPTSALYYYTPNFNYIGPDSFAFTVTNSLLQTSLPATVSIIVTDIVPTALPQTAIVVENSIHNILTLNGTDPGGQTLTFAAPGTSTHGTLTFVSNPSKTSALYEYTPTFGYSGSDSFTFAVTNTSLQTSAPATVFITVSDTPVAYAKVVSFAVNSTNNAIALTGTDPLGQMLTFALGVGNGPSNGALSGFNSSTGAVLYTPNNQFSGTDTFAFIVTNASGVVSAQAVVTITIQ